MNVPTSRIEELASALLNAEDRRRLRAPITDDWSGFDLDTAYRVQDEALRQRVSRGETVVGVKLGLTSRAKQERMGVDTPLVAWLTDAMLLASGSEVPHSRLIHPRLEPEIAFVMGADLSGPAVTASAALQAVASVHAAVEIIDSRYADFRFKLPDVVADNASSAAFCMAPAGVHPQDLDLALEACLVEVQGEVVDSATGAAVQGHPAEALALAANSLDSRGHRLQEGWIVLTGGMTDALPITAKASVTVSFSTLGAIHVPGEVKRATD